MNKEKKSYQVNYLLSISRLPDHFYALMHNLSGRDSIYQNPGTALRSYLIAKCLDRETCIIEGELNNDIRLCEEFSLSANILSEITKLLMTQATKVMEQVSTLEPVHAKTLVAAVGKLHEASQFMKISFDSFIMTQDPSKNHVDILSFPGITLKESMFDLQDLILETSWAVSKVIPEAPPPEYA